MVESEKVTFLKKSPTIFIWEEPRTGIGRTHNFDVFQNKGSIGEKNYRIILFTSGLIPLFIRVSRVHIIGVIWRGKARK